MGEVKVPASALWGAQTARAVANFPISGLREPRALVDAVVRVKLAAARVNARLGLLPRGKGRAIEPACREVLAGRWDGQFVVDAYQAGRRDLVPHERERGAGQPGRRDPGRPPRRPLGRSQRRRQHGPVDQRRHPHRHAARRARQPRPAVVEALEGLAATFARKARAWDGIVKAGRTHLMDATPIRLGQEVSGWAAALLGGGRRG